jgi:para-nitrobenzyl esterase
LKTFKKTSSLYTHNYNLYKMRSALLFLLFTISSFFAIADDCGQRYRDDIFNRFVELRDVPYGFNYDNKNIPTTLLMDINLPPDEDTASFRPLMIFVHGGSFVGGNKRAGQHARIARDMAKKGYVTSSINYRVQRNLIDVIDPVVDPFLEFADRGEWYRAITRAFQDVKAAVRYHKRLVAEEGNPYRIDTNNIILYGSSAGAITVLHAVYLTDLDDALPVFKAAVNGLGGLDGDSGSPGYGSTNGIRAVVTASGAMSERRWLSNRSDVAFQAFHHTTDPTVPFGFGCFVTAACHLGRFYGSSPLWNYAKDNDIRTELHTINSVGHPADDDQPELVLSKMIPFLYQLQCEYEPRITSVKNSASLSTRIYPNPSKGLLQADIPAEWVGQNVLVEYYNIAGALVFSERLIADKVLRTQLAVSPGTYMLRIRPENSLSVPISGKFMLVP